MRAQKLRTGMHIKIGGQEYRIEQRLPNGDLQLKHLASETLSAKPEAEIIKSIFDGGATLLGSNGEVNHLEKRSAQSLVNDFAALEDTDPRKKEAHRKLKYIKGIRRQGITKFGKNDQNLRPVIDEVSKTIDDPYPPSCGSLARWHRDYRASGDDIRVLAPAYKARGRVGENDGRRISDDLATCQAVDKIIDDVIHEEYLSLTRPTVQFTYDLIVARIAQENKFRSDDDQLPTPHKNTIYRVVNKLDPYEKDKARFGKRIADLRHKVNKQGVRPTRPLELVEIDDTKLDLFVIDEETKLPIGRPWLFIEIDVFTKMILGYYLSFVRPSYLSVMQCLLHSIRPKTYLSELYPEIVHSWDAYGIPELVKIDNAKQYYSASFDEACLQLGILTQYAPVKVPYYKPSVERMFGSLNTRLLHQIPGTTFSNVSEKWDYDPKKNALISLADLERVLHNWIVDVYHHSHHRGISDVPARRWEVGIKDFPPALPYNSEELEVLLGHVEHRVISNSGIEIFGLYYNDPCLSALRTSKKKGEKVKIKYDPMDISLIHVYDSKINTYLPVPAVDQDYTTGLTLWQHKVIKREARASAEEYVDIVELCLAKERIQKIVDGEFNAQSSSASNVKAALWQSGGKSSGRVEVSDPETNSDPGQQNNGSGTARLSPHNNHTAGTSNLPSAVAQNSADHTTTIGEGVSGVEIVEAVASKKAKSNDTRRGNRRGTKNPPEGVSQGLHEDCESSAADNCLSVPPAVPIIHTAEEDLDLGGWESDYDLPGKKR